MPSIQAKKLTRETRSKQVRCGKTISVQTRILYKNVWCRLNASDVTSIIKFEYVLTFCNSNLMTLLTFSANNDEKNNYLIYLL